MTDDPVVRLARQHADLADTPAGPDTPAGDTAGRRTDIEAADPDARAVFAALDRTRADLADLGAAPTPPVPPGLLADVDRALADERTARRPRRPRRPRRDATLLVAAAAVLLVVGAIAAITAVATVPAGPRPAPSATPDDRPVIRRDDLPSALRRGLADDPAGPPGPAGGGLAADPARLAGCLAAHGAAGVRPIAARRVLLDGTPGVLVVLPTGIGARFRVLVVGEACAPGAPLTLADAVVGR